MNLPARRSEHHHGLASLALLVLAVWGSVTVLPDVLRYIRILRM
jgi:hypothetical protein